MNHFITILAALFFCVFSQTAMADSQTVSAEMQMLSTATSWVNQSGSVASISFAAAPTQPATYIVSGHYVNNAAGYQCQGTAYPLNGIYYTNTQTISFSVAWSNSTENCQSVTGWTGYIDLSTSPLKMITKWNLAYLNSGSQQIFPGSDTFTMQSVVTSEKLISE
ncbi:MAG: hypothetical protein JKX91_11395 [Rhizobiaceae bacterium]|nr:hypothetical protein [Rhizobiaceae bacterium]